MSKIAVITGGSSGLGLAAAQRFAAGGWQVYELSRSGHDREGIIHIPCDLTQSPAIEDAFARIRQEAGHIDLLINNAGMGVSGPTELLDEEQVRRMMDVDFFAVWLCVKAALPLLRQAEAGRIINISSVAAVFAIPFQSFYTAAKAAVSGLTQALALELAPMGISVTALLPGDVRTGFTAARVKVQDQAGLYQGAAERSIAIMEHDEKNGMAPERLAEALWKLAHKRKVKPFYTCGIKYKFFLFLGKILPCALINKILAMMYCPKK